MELLNCITCTGTYIVDAATGICGCASDEILLDNGNCQAIVVIDPCENKPYTFEANLTCTDNCQDGTPAHYLLTSDNKCYPCHFSCPTC